MPRLIIIRDIFRRELEQRELQAGPSLGAQLMQLFPEGVRDWRIYAGFVGDAHRIEPAATKFMPVGAADQFVMVRMPGADPLSIAINIGISLLLSAAAYLLTPKPRRPLQTFAEQQESPSSQISAQQNVLRPGARVPELLGCVRVYPDLLTNAVEWWDGRQQTIDEWFVIGVGQYSVIEKKLGDTPYEMITGAALPTIEPGTPIDEIECVKTSSNVNQIDLDAEDGTVSPPVPGVDFFAASKTMSADAPLPVNIGGPTTIGGTLNAGFHFVLSQSGAEPPWVYQLNGSVVNETDVNPSFTNWSQNVAQGYGGVDVNADTITFTTYFTNAYLVGDAIHLIYQGVDYYGKINAVLIYSTGPNGQNLRLEFRDMNGLPFALGTATNQGIFLTNWRPPPSVLAASGPSPSPLTTQTYPTDWVGVPMADPDQIWCDISFPRGLSHFQNSTRLGYEVGVHFSFRRGLTGPVVTIPKTYSGHTSVPLRYTQKFFVSDLVDLGLTGSGQIMVQLQRTTRQDVDTPTDTYVSECRWFSLRAEKTLRNQSFPDITLARLRLQNSRSASSIGEYAVNMKVTRILPTWTGTGSIMTPQPAPDSGNPGTRKWADNFVARCHAKDGANLPYDKIDLAGIYALQAQLDAIDGGKAGEISLVLDQLTDMDTELAEIADVVRAYVYRTGQRIFVTRDQQTNSSIALFNGRTKSPDGESTSLRMKSGDEHDAVVVQWIDEGNGFKQRELQHPAGTATNVLRVATKCANWEQAWRRARFEWAKLLYRREQITVPVTEDGRICRPGDVVNITDDIANLALIAGEVQHVSGSVLTLDKQVDFSVPGTYSIVLRDIHGMLVDWIPCTAVAGSPYKVQLSRSTGVVIKPKDLSMGTLYAFHRDTASSVRQWLLTAVVAGGPYVQLTGFNYTARVYADDTTAVDPKPPIG